MDRLPQDVLDSIRDFVVNKGGTYPDLSDMLVAFWDEGHPEAPNPYLPRYTLGVTALAGYLNFSHSKRWAWDALDRLFKVLMERREPIPELLQIHVNRAYAGTKPPRKPSSDRFAPQDDRDMRIMRVHKVLRCVGMTEKDAKDAIMDALVHDMDGDSARSVFRKMQTFSPFKSGTKQAP